MFPAGFIRSLWLSRGESPQLVTLWLGVRTFATFCILGATYLRSNSTPKDFSVIVYGMNNGLVKFRLSLWVLLVLNSQVVIFFYFKWPRFVSLIAQSAGQYIGHTQHLYESSIWFFSINGGWLSFLQLKTIILNYFRLTFGLYLW